MKTVKITCTIEEPIRIEAGTILEVSDELAADWIEKDIAIEFEYSIPKRTKKEVKNGDG